MGNWFNDWLFKVQNVDWGQAVATFFTGIIVVFSALIVLVVIFWAFGKIMENIGTPREKKNKKEEPLVPSASPKLVEVVSDDGLSDEVVAAITGAVSVILSEEGNNGSFVIKSIKRTRQTSSAWGTAGVIENTRPF